MVKQQHTPLDAAAVPAPLAAAAGHVAVVGPYLLVHQLSPAPSTAGASASSGSSSSHATFVAERADSGRASNNRRGASAYDQQQQHQPLFLVRIYPLRTLACHHRERIGLERHILTLRLLTARGCPSVIPLVDVFETDQHDLVIVEEYCEGGELFELLDSFNRERRQHGSSLPPTAAAPAAVFGLPLKVTRRLLTELLEAVDQLHSVHRLCHRDIKLEHLFLDDRNGLRLGGFGMAVPVTDDIQGERSSSSSRDACARGETSIGRRDARSTMQGSNADGSSPRSAAQDESEGDDNDSAEALLTVMCGSRHYAAPEIIRAVPYSGCAADMWSIGVCAFALLTGTFPFADVVPVGPSSAASSFPGADGIDPIHRLLLASPDFARIEYPEAKDFVLKLLTENARVRMTAPQALRHSFVAGIVHNHRERSLPRGASPERSSSAAAAAAGVATGRPSGGTAALKKQKF
jgi:serine/threonine protein kinase